MTQVNRSGCVVCGNADARALEDVVVEGGVRATLCGSHALMHRRLPTAARTPQTVAELRGLLADRRERRDRRQDGDELGAALTAAFSGSRREGDRRLT
jgi:hypothetical protein